MKKIVRFLSLAVALGFALEPAGARAANQNIDVRVGRLNTLVGLSADQQAKVTEIIGRENAALDALPPSDRLMKGMELRQASRDAVRAVLTPVQQKKYDRTPQFQGGGLSIPTPETKVANLDQVVHLSAAQKAVALEVFTEEFESLLALPASERMERGTVFRQAAREQARALLTPEQREKQDGLQRAAVDQAVEERTFLENSIKGSAGIAARLGAVSSITRGGSSTSQSGETRSGEFTFKVTGANRSETLVVHWEKNSAGSMKITKITGSGGETIKP